MQVYSLGQLIVRSLTLGELDTNCYLITDRGTSETIIIDPADSAESIIEVITTEQLKPTAIILTHAHFDHVLGLLELQLSLGLPVFMHPADEQLLASAQSSAQHWLGHAVDPVPKSSQAITEDNTFQLGTLIIQVLHTPGHTPGSICLLVSQATQPLALLTGDTVFKDGVGRTDFSYSKPLQLRDSLDRLLQFPAELLCFPGHGPHSTLAQIKQQLS